MSTTPAIIAATPAYEHDCDRCRYLGTVTTPKRRVDLYECREAGTTLVARFSDEGWDYSSTPAEMVSADSTPELRMAKVLAKG